MSTSTAFGSASFSRFVWCCILLSAFYLVGCVVFFYLERDAELQRYVDNKSLYEQMRKMQSFEYCEDPAFQELSFCKSQAAFAESLEEYFNQHGNSIVDLEQWTPFGCFFFLTHLATTIGYGTNSPQTALGQLATIVFALVGIPIMGYTLAQVARFNLHVGILVVEKVFCAKVRTVRDQVLVLFCLLLIFLLGGAYVYSRLEPWSFLESLYFCFVTLSTVGFGDYLPSSTMSRAFSIFYIIFGLGVCASMIGALTGFVAEGHDSVDTYVKQKLQEFQCCVERERERPSS